jgi:agmatinase
MRSLDSTAVPACGFLDWSIVTDPSAWVADVALIGLPHSEPYAGEPCPNDQSRAPDAIRRASSQISDGRDHWDFDFGTPLSSILPDAVIDCGNVPWLAGAYDAQMDRATALLRHLWRRGTQVFVLGGDHGVTIPALDALDLIGRPVHVLHIDAHLDWRADVSGVRRGYSSPLYWASQKPWISGMTQIGMRGTGSARRQEVEAARDYGSTVVTAAQIHSAGIAPVVKTIPERSSLYVTIDADGLDPAEMPGVMAPVPGGLRFSQVADLLRTVAQLHRIVGLDVVEVAPSFDSANRITCIAAGRLILNALGSSWAPDGGYRRSTIR